MNYAPRASKAFSVLIRLSLRVADYLTGDELGCQ